jgi:hypothetical protein
MLDKIKQFVNWMHERGIPLPLLRDFKHGQPSVSYTMMVTSFVVCLAGLVGKISNFLGDVDMSQALILLGITSSLYFGRQAQINTANKTLDFSAVSEDNTEKEE